MPATSTAIARVDVTCQQYQHECKTPLVVYVCMPLCASAVIRTPQPLMEEFKYVSQEFSHLAMELLAQVEQYWSKYVEGGVYVCEMLHLMSSMDVMSSMMERVPTKPSKQA